MTSLIVTPNTFLTYSLGCRTNQAEIEDISLQLMAHGFKQIGDRLLTTDYRLQQPDLILLNTCVVTKKAEKETRQKIRELRIKHPDAFLVVLGCAATAREKFNIPLPQADLLIPNEQKNRTTDIIEQKLCSHSVARAIFNNKYTLSGRKFVKIQDGCDKFCSYCITCHLRGEPVSIPLEKIINKINFWVEKGIKEVILTGINIALYGRDTKNQINLTTLIDLISKKTKIERISFSSIYPEMLNEDFLKTVVNNPKISQNFHLSLQSGSQTVLQRMNRKTNLPELLKTLKFIKTKNPFFTFRADIIIGFPNETEREFQETLEFIRKAKIPFVHSFLFSIRPGTQAGQMIKSGTWKEVPLAVKKKRSEILKEMVEKIRNNEARRIGGKQLSNVTPCLIVRLLSCHLAEGITENGWPIVIGTMNNEQRTMGKLKGKILPVKITKFENNQLLGKILSLPT